MLLWKPSQCIDLFVMDYIFVSFLGNKYDDDGDPVSGGWSLWLWAPSGSRKLKPPWALGSMPALALPTMGHCGGGRHVPPSTSNCLIFQITSEPHKLWHSTAGGCLTSNNYSLSFVPPSHQILATPLHAGDTQVTVVDATYYKKAKENQSLNLQERKLGHHVILASLRLE